MIKCYWLTNHNITREQEHELRQKFSVDSIVIPPDSISELWKSVPTKDAIPEENILLVENWLSDISSEDIAVVHGEPTISFKIVNFLLNRDIKVLASVAERKSRETMADGRIIKESVFEHICFRAYER